MDGTKKCPFCGTEFNSDPNNQPQQNTYNNNYNNNYNSNYNNNYGNYGNYSNYAPLPQPTFRTKSSPNVLGLIASVIIFVTIFLPFFTMTSGITESGVAYDFSLSDGKDWILFVTVAVLGAIFSLMKTNKGVFTVGIISVILTIGEAILSSESRLMSKMNDVKEMGEYWKELVEYLDISIGYSYGFYTMLAGAVMLLIAGIYGIKQNSSSSF
jgi:hypothetical protein